AGGTGGHVIPALTIAEEMQEKGISTEWVGTKEGIEARLIPAAGIPIHYVNARGLRGKGSFNRLMSGMVFLFSMMSIIRIFFLIRPSLVLGMGGYVSGACGIVARLLRIPLVIHEQNAIPGLTNRILAKFSDRVLTGYPGIFPALKDKARYTGNPVRRDIGMIPPPEVRIPSHEGPVRILVMGGSQGSACLNKILPGAIKALSSKLDVKVVHQTGEKDELQVREYYLENGLDAVAVAFIDDIAEYYAWADILIARSGALTVAEIMAVGIGSILIPYPYAVDDHQRINALELEKAGACHLLDEKCLHEDTLLRLLSDMDRDRLTEMAVSAYRLGMPDATRQVVE
ncbi:MAG: undecaprenyldiphospho-muramoylpentapeptide beta-N-acetylglucosaminyltransferase, partial [Gammaproteobacteria bacterium]